METTLNKGKISRDLTSGNLVKKIIFYLIPLFLTSVLQLLFTTMDIFTVTHFGGGNSSSGAIGSTNSLVVLILCVFQGLAAGAGVVISNAKGAKDFDKISKSVGSCTLIMIISGIFVSIFGVLFARKLLLLLNTSDEFIDNATLYLTIYFIGAPLNLLQNSGAAILRSLGDSKRPFVATIFSGITNICLNFLFVIGFNQDVKGVAIATIASQGICALVLYLFLMKDKRLSGNFSFRYLRFYKEETLEIIRLGFFTGLQSFIFNFTNVNVQRCVNELGAAQVIGKSAGSSIEGYEYVLLNAISTTCLVAVGQNFGAKKGKNIKKVLFISIILELVLVTLFSGIVLLFNKPILSIFINQSAENSAEANKYAISSITILGLLYALCGIPECQSNFLRGMKYSIIPTIVSLFCIVGVRLALIYLVFPLEKYHDFTHLMLIYPISWITCCLVYIPICIIFGKKKLKTIESLD